jgi:hypothetical protein
MFVLQFCFHSVRVVYVDGDRRQTEVALSDDETERQLGLRSQSGKDYNVKP